MDHNLRPHLQSRLRGVMLGLAVGDALGARFEGAPYVDAAHLEEHFESVTELRYTDDTHMTIGVAQSLLEFGSFDGERMTARLMENYYAEPWRGYGAGPPLVFRMIREGHAWDQAARILYEGQGSFGNGAAMRVAPAAMASCSDPDQVEWLARQTAVITHAHELGIEGAVLQACAVAHLLNDDVSRPLDGSRLLDMLRARLKQREFQRALDEVGELLTETDEDRVAAILGNGIEATAAVPDALWAFLHSPASFPAAIRAAIRLAGDTDTIASMTGALSGAYLGAAAIPERWRGQLESAAMLADLADGLYAAMR